MVLKSTPSIEVRPYQEKAIEEIDHALMKHRRVLLVSPTGSGKTIIAGRLAELIRRASKRCIFLVHKRELFFQAINTLTRFGLGDELGTVSADNTQGIWLPFIVASIPTLVRRPGLRIDADFVIVDEAHHAAARTWSETLDRRWPHAKIIGLTATPRRTDKQAMGSNFDFIVQTPQIGEMINEGFLSDFDILKPPYSLRVGGVKQGADDFDKSSLTDKLSSTKGKTIVEVFESWAKHARSMKTIVFAVDVAHSKKLAAKFTEAGVRCAHIDADSNKDLRDKTLNLFRDGRIQVITNVNLISEGVDVPDCQCVVMARPTLSLIDYFQQAGRMMRPKAGGAKGLLLDLAGNFYIHGFTPKDVVEWSLDGEANPGKDRAEVKPISYHTCEVCIRPYNSTKLICPYCGHKRTKAGQRVDEIEASLIRHKGGASESFKDLVDDIYRGRVSMQSIINDIHR